MSMGIEVTVDHTIERGDGYVELDVKVMVHRGSPGRLSGPPEDCYPAEPDEIEIVGLSSYGVDWGCVRDSMADEEIEKIAELASMEAFEDACDYEDERDQDGAW